MPTVMTSMTHTPEILIVDGGATHANTTRVLRARGMCTWGRVRGKTTMVWRMAKRPTDDNSTYATDGAMARELDAAMQRRMRRAYMEVGAQRFRRTATPEDFHLDRADQATAVREENWGELDPKAEARMTRFWDWPDEPATERALLDSAEITGKEVEERLTDDEVRERELDLIAWRQEGQTWWGAMLPTAQEAMRTYIKSNERVNDAVATAVSRLSSEGAEGPKYDDFAGAATKNEITIRQEDYRPGARGKIWSWVSGQCEECVPSSIEMEVMEAGGYTSSKVREVADILAFPDRRSTQVLTDTGTTHGTVGFPFTSYAGRNHQGSGAHHRKLTAMMTSKVEEEHFAAVKGNHPASDTPLFHPFGVVPMNGSEARQKDLESYERERDGFDIAKVIRGTYNGSFPHDGSSPNDHCCPEEGTQKPWVATKHVVRNANVLRAIGAPTVKGFKLDLKAAYTQLFHQITQRWRQHVYWRWEENGSMKGGYMADKRCEWGQAMSGTWFHRSVTSLMVRWIEKALKEEWVPTISCETTRQWIKERLAAFPDQWDLSEEEKAAEKNNPSAPKRSPKNRNSTQSVPGFVQGFLDDFWIFIAGTPEDVATARVIVMKAFEHLGFIVSKSKLATEGTPDPEIVILGHDFNMDDGSRGVTDYKRIRIQDQAKSLGTTEKWSRKKLEQLVGLIQSIRDDVNRRWNLQPLYEIMRWRDGKKGQWVYPTARAKAVLVKVIGTLHERRPLAARRTRWVIPTAPTLMYIVNTDASSLEGLGGAVLLDGVLEYFGEKWRDDIRKGTIVDDIRKSALVTDGKRQPLVTIAVLEALAVIVAAAIWGHRWSGRKIVMRSDSSPTCFSFNKLASRDPAMSRVAELWEDVQYYFHFEGLMVHCKGATNEIADRASRLDESALQAGIEEAAKLEELPVEKCQRLPSQWSFGLHNIDILDDLILLTKQPQAARNNKTASPPHPTQTTPITQPRIISLRN